MTEVNLKVKLHVVDKLFVGSGYRTDVWISEAASSKVCKFVDGKRSQQGRAFLKKVKRYAEIGFGVFEGKKRPIQREWGDVWRVAYRESLFRLIGFYDSGKQCFIVIDAFMKRGMQLSEGQKKRITEVGRVKRFGSWIRRDHE